MSKMLKMLKVLKVLIEHLACLAGWYSSCGGETSVTGRQVGAGKKVCAISALCAISPFFVFKRKGKNCFSLHAESELSQLAEELVF